MRVYRIEVNGVGPYRSGRFPVGWANGPHQPCPQDDGLRGCQGRLFGFRTLADLRRWWHTHYHDLRRAHADVVTYEASDVRVGSSQVAFLPDSAQCIGRCRIQDIAVLDRAQQVDTAYAVLGQTRHADTVRQLRQLGFRPAPIASSARARIKQVQPFLPKRLYRYTV